MVRSGRALLMRLCLFASILATGHFAGHAQVRPNAAPLFQSIWLEAEWFGPLQGANFSFQNTNVTTKGSWSLSGPDTAASWTQGGESEFLSIAARADEPGELIVSREVEIPSAAAYTLWVRFSDYLGKESAFGVRTVQNGKSQPLFFGKRHVVDELDPMKLLWGWSYGWDNGTVILEKGPVLIQIFTTGPTEARRCIDCLCLTTDTSYHPAGREKPDHPTWAMLRAMRANPASVEPFTSAPEWPREWSDIWQQWNITADKPPLFLWNVGDQWLNELKKPASERIGTPFGVENALLKDFVAEFKGKPIPVYGHSLSAPVFRISQYPQIFSAGSPFHDWLDDNPKKKYALLWNYAEPEWPKNTDHTLVNRFFEEYSNRFIGLIAGEGLSYAPPDSKEIEARVHSAASRSDVLRAFTELNADASRKKLTDYFGKTLTAEQAWGKIISCLSANNEAFAHALPEWGSRYIGHENSGNSPTLARRLAFLRGAARQFHSGIVDYQSCNLGDASATYGRESYFFPASSRYILDNSYDAFAGAGINWLLKDYLLFHLSGASAFYHEEGQDVFWKPGGNSAGDSFPVQLSPRGRVTEFVQHIAADHPRGAQYTPIAFLLDHAHGYSQERYAAGSFAMEPRLNPSVLRVGQHEAAIRGWFDVAYFPAPETQNEPASGIRQTYVNGMFGDIFDVIVTAPNRTQILSTYAAVILAGEVELTKEWAAALNRYINDGGTVVVSAAQLRGPGAADLHLPPGGAVRETVKFTWLPTNQAVDAQRFHCVAIAPGKDRIIATLPDGTPIAICRKTGRGRLVYLGVPLGIGIDQKPVPILALLMRHLVEDVTPFKVTGDVEWIVSRFASYGWLVTLLNNRGVIKPQHGILPTDPHEAQTVTITTSLHVSKCTEWVTAGSLVWKSSATGASASVTIPAGTVRIIEIHE